MRRIALLAAFALAPGVALAAGEAHADEGWSRFLAQTVDFLILVGVLVYFLRKPFGEFFRQRRHDVEQNLAEAAQLLAEAQSRLAEFERRTANLDAELREVQESARQRTDAERIRILEDAKNAAARIRRDATAAIEQEARRAREALRAEAAALAIELAAKIVREQVNDGDRARLVDEFVSRVRETAAPAATGGR